MNGQTSTAPMIIIVDTSAIVSRFHDYEVVVLHERAQYRRGPDWEAFAREALRIQHYRKVEFRENRVREAKTARTRPRTIPESQFNKPTFVRRACGGRWRVMHP